MVPRDLIGRVKLEELRWRHAWLRAGRSFSQEGEDRIVEELTYGLAPDLYVNVGAFDPVRFSNTALLHRRGWRGVNIEPRPEAKERFERLRPHDAMYSVGISNSEGNLTYYEFDEPALNTFDPVVAVDRDANTPYRLVGTREIPTLPLKTVLEDACVPSRFGLLTVDVEGFDLEVLQSNDWHRFRPRLLLVEDRDRDLERIDQSATHRFVRDRGYRLIAATPRTLMYREGQ